jgi:tRNA (guanosine-2'-O-)-methyltransferase
MHSHDPSGRSALTRFEKMKYVLDLRQPDLTVVIENVHKPYNLAAILRTCDSVGISEVRATAGRNAIRTAQRAASGSYKWVEIVMHPSVLECYRLLKERGFKILVAHFGQDALDYRELDYTTPTALVVGAELDGISKRAIENADQMVTVPMLGMASSLNVSVATALILAEAYRQRKEAGCYQNSRLDEKTYRRLLFKWMHPQVSAFCDKKGIPYPRMDEKGDIVEPLVSNMAKTIADT